MFIEFGEINTELEGTFIRSQPLHNHTDKRRHMYCSHLRKNSILKKENSSPVVLGHWNSGKLGPSRVSTIKGGSGRLTGSACFGLRSTVSRKAVRRRRTKKIPGFGPVPTRVPHGRRNVPNVQGGARSPETLQGLNVIRVRGRWGWSGRG